MKMLYFCLLLGYYALGIPIISSYPLPQGVVHVFFMHRQQPQIFQSYMPPYNISEPNFANSLYPRDNSEPNIGNSLYSNLHNPVFNPLPPMGKLYHDMMSYLDRSMGSIADLDREYNKAMTHKVEDPWVHFITRTKSVLTEPNKKANTTMIESNTTHTTEIDWNATVLGNHTNGNTDRSYGNMDVTLTPHVTNTTNMTYFVTDTLQKDDGMNKDKVKVNTTMVAKLNGSKCFDDLAEHITVNDTIGFPVFNKTIQLVRRARRHSNTSRLELVATKMSAEKLNGSTTTNPLNMLLGSQSQTLWNDMNQTRDNQQTDNQTKEIVSFTSTVEKMIDLIDKQLENQTQALLKRMKRVMEIKDDLLKDNIGGYVKYVAKTNTESNGTKQAVHSTLPNDDNMFNKTLDTTGNETKTTDTTTGALQTMATLANATPIEPLANTTVTISPASNDNDQNNLTSLPAPLEYRTTVQTDSKPVENSTNEQLMKLEPTCTFSVLSMLPQAASVFSGNTDGNSSDKHNSDINTPSRTLAKTTEIEEEDENGQSRNILDYVPDENNMMDKSRRPKDDDEVTNADLMTALVIPVFLVVLMGSILYAMHNMSQYVINYMGESNIDSTNQDNQELTTLIVTNPEPSDITPTANQINTNRSPSKQDNNKTLIVKNPEPTIAIKPGNTGETVSQSTPSPDDIKTNPPPSDIKTKNTEKTP
uniref:Uncharacterized protein n=1 Tax=Cacopsylla melanoneura TaxID=428564 RepID=A0A8D9F556_9HEMI